MSLIQSVVSHRQLLLGLVRWSVILKTCCFYAIHASLVINVKKRVGSYKYKGCVAAHCWLWTIWKEKEGFRDHIPILGSLGSQRGMNSKKLVKREQSKNFHPWLLEIFGMIVFLKQQISLSEFNNSRNKNCVCCHLSGFHWGRAQSSPARKRWGAFCRELREAGKQIWLCHFNHSAHTNSVFF